MVQDRSTGKLAPVVQPHHRTPKNNYVRCVVAPADSLQGLHSKREFAIQSVDLSSRCELLRYLIDPVGIERNMPLDLHDSRKRILVRPHCIDGLLSSSGNALVIAIAFIETVGCVIRPFQLGKINVLTWNVLNGRIRRFAERQGVGISSLGFLAGCFWPSPAFQPPMREIGARFLSSFDTLCISSTIIANR
jgi:hypothetical protein